MKKTVFTVVLLVLLACGLLAQARNTSVNANGVAVNLINNGWALKFVNQSSSTRTVDLVIYLEGGGSQVKSFDIDSVESNKMMFLLFQGLTGSGDGSETISLDRRATGISLPTAAQISTLRAQREAAAAERERREAAERAERERREAAERSERETAERIRREAPAYLQSGTEAYQRGDYDRAIADFTRSIQGDPRNATAYNNRGAAYNGKRDWDRAITDFTEAIRLDPNYAASYRHRGFAYMQRGNFGQARADVDKALQLNPNYQNARDLSAELQRRGY